MYHMYREHLKSDEIVYEDTNNRIIFYNENDEKTAKYFDGLGRITKIERYKDTLWAQWLYRYNYLDKPEQMTDPLFRVYQYGYDSLGRATRFINPDQTVRTMEYDDITNTVTVRDENQHKKEYTFSWTGNLLSIKEHYDSTTSKEWFESTEVHMYDDLNRLVSASNDFRTLLYTYDSRNRLSSTENGETTSYVYDYDFLLSAGDKTFTYDANGNTLTKSSESEWVYHYDTADRLIQVDRTGEPVGQYMYDGDGRRIKKIEWSEDLQQYITTIYMYSGSEVIYEKTNHGSAIYIYGPTGILAKRTTIRQETDTFYYLTDHMDSTRLVTDSHGAPLTSVNYYPFGKHQYSGSPESYLFTGKERDSTGLYYFGARYYDPELGRFLTRDPYTFLPDDPRVVGNSSEPCMQRLTDPQRFNRFSYTRNNPLRYKDPTGLLFQCIDTECQDLFDGGEDPPPDDLAPDGSHDEHESREEECRECDCKDRPDIKALRKLKTKVTLGELGVASAYALLCGVAGAMLCSGTGPGAAGCGIVAAFICGTAVGLLIDASVQDVIDDIHHTMDRLGCSCAIYCP